MMTLILAFVISLILFGQNIEGLDDGLALTPQVGDLDNPNVDVATNLHY